WEPGVRHLRAGDLEVDLWSQECTLSGTQLQLSPTEYSLLTFLMTHAQQALATHTIVRRVWGWLPSDGKNALRIFVNRLRRKLGDDPRHPVYIASVRGTGYRFIRNVAELGDTAETANDRVDVSPLLRTVEDLARVLQSCDSLHDGAESLLGALDATGYADGMAVFRVDGSSMQLVASRNMPESWTEAVKAGVPLKPSYASAQSVLMGEPVQFGDVTAVAKHFSSTAVQLEGFGACLFIPIMLRSSVWGHLGFVRRSRQPFDVTGTAFLRTVCAVFALGIERARAAQQVETPR
ncbi:MAG: winged helix-turn-helix domain-containing protein, partial [Acidimicrobiia bacterium]